MNEKSNRLLKAISKQIEIMAALRNKENGCPWDIVQTFKTIAPYTIEEAYEVADAIEKQNMNALKEELGDLVFQVAFYSRMAEEENLFDFCDVIENLNEKMISRHPHVFGENNFASPDEVSQNWEKLKAIERENKIKNDNSILADIALPLPALSRALKLSKRAARVGFDWENIDQIFDKLNEEIYETKEAISEKDINHIEEEIGDILFVIVNLARKCEIDPENALKSANSKFERRFREIEKSLAKIGKNPQSSTIEEMEKLWLEAKLKERI